VRILPGTMSSHACCVSLLQNSEALSGVKTGSGLNWTICWEKWGAKPVISPASSNAGALLWGFQCRSSNNPTMMSRRLVSSNHFHAFIFVQIVLLGRSFSLPSVSQSSTSVLLDSECASPSWSALYRRSSFMVVFSPSSSWETSCVGLNGANAGIGPEKYLRVLLVYRAEGNSIRTSH
jgi:hypothetical protein